MSFKVMKRVIGLLRLGSAKLALDDSGAGTNTQRRLYKLDAEASLVEILIINSRDIVWRLTELVNFLIALTELDDKFKYEMCECGADHASLQVYLNRILFNGNLTEKEHVLKLIWKLTSEPRVASAIKKDIDLYSYIIGLSLNMHNKSKNLLRYSNYILFALNTSGTQPPTQSRHTNLSSASTTSTTSSGIAAAAAAAAAASNYRSESKSAYNSVYSSPSMNRKSFQDHEYLQI
jgi:hypothetical protein